MDKLRNLQFELDHFTPTMRQVEQKETFCKMSFYVYLQELVKQVLVRR